MDRADFLRALAHTAQQAEPDPRAEFRTRGARIRELRDELEPLVDQQRRDIKIMYEMRDSVTGKRLMSERDIGEICDLSQSQIHRVLVQAEE